MNGASVAASDEGSFSARPEVSEALKVKVGNVETDLWCGPLRRGEELAAARKDVVLRGVEELARVPGVGGAGKTKSGLATKSTTSWLRFESDMAKGDD